MVLKSSFSEKEIVAECLKDNRTYQKILYEKYKNGMYTVVYRILRDEDLSCDAVQEGFIQVFLNLKSFRFKSTLGSWIKTIMIRSALKLIKKEIKHEELGDTAENIPVHWDDNLTGETLEKAISKLSSGHRVVFLLIEVEGYSHKEVADMLKISVGTSKSRLSRAKVILQECLKEMIN